MLNPLLSQEFPGISSWFICPESLLPKSAWKPRLWMSRDVYVNLVDLKPMDILLQMEPSLGVPLKTSP